MNELKTQRRRLPAHQPALLLALGVVSGLSFVSRAAEAQSGESKIHPGMQCIAADGWWSLDRQQPTQPEPVRVTKIQAMTSSEAGVWVQPLRGPMSGHQYLISIDRLSGCKS